MRTLLTEYSMEKNDEWECLDGPQSYRANSVAERDKLVAILANQKSR